MKKAILFLLTGLLVAFTEISQADDPWSFDTPFDGTSNMRTNLDGTGEHEGRRDRQYATSFEIASEFEGKDGNVGFHFKVNKMTIAINTDVPNQSNSKPLLTLHENDRVNGDDVPGEQVGIFHYLPESISTNPIRRETYTISSGGKLKTNMKHWLVASLREDVGNPDHTYTLIMRHHDGQNGWEIGNGHLRRTRVNGEWGNWGASTGADQSLMFSLNVTPRFDIHADMVMSNLSTHEGERRFVGGRHPRRAVSFYVGDNHYGATYRIKVVVQHYDPHNTEYGYVVPRVWPGPRIYSDTPRGESKPHERIGAFGWWQGSWQSRNFFKRQNESNSSYVRVKPHRKYWMTFDTHFNSRGVSQSEDRQYHMRYFVAPRTGTYRSLHGWQIGTGEMISNDEGNTWQTSDNEIPLQFGLRATRYLPKPFKIGENITPGNLKEANVGSEFEENARVRSIDTFRWIAVPFYTTTRPDSPPHIFRINHITMLNPIRSLLGYNGGDHVIAIYDSGRHPDNFWKKIPGREIGRFSTEGLPEIISGNFPGATSDDRAQQHRFHAESDAPILVEPHRTYWVLQKMENWNSGTSSITNLDMPCFTQSGYQEGWAIGDYYWRTYNKGQSWLEVNEQFGVGNDWTMRFGFGATVIASPRSGDFNLDGKIDVLDLILINDHIRGVDRFPSGSVLLRLGEQINGPGSLYLDHRDRELLIDWIMER